MTTAQTKRRFLRVVGYVCFFVACYLVALIVTFPYDTLTSFVERRASAALNREVTIDKVRPTPTGAIRLEGVTLGPGKQPPGPQADSGVPGLQIERATVRVGLLALVFGGADVRFDLDVADGRARGRYRQSSEEVALKLTLEKLQARRLPSLREKIGLPIKGTIDGEVEFTVPVGKANESTGSLRLALEGFVIGDGEAKLSVSRFMSFGKSRGGSAASDDGDEGLPIPAITLGPMVVQSSVEGGEVEIPRVEATSPDAEISFEGRIKLAEPLSQSRVDTYLTFKLTDAYVSQDEAVEDVMKLVNIYGRQAKRSDGSLGFRLSGTLGGGLVPRPAKTFAGVRDSGRGDGGSAARRRHPSPRRPSAGAARERDGETGRISAPPSIGVRPPRPSPGVDREQGGDEAYPSGMPRPRPPVARIPPPQQEGGAEQAEETAPDDNQQVEEGAEGEDAVEEGGGSEEEAEE